MITKDMAQRLMQQMCCRMVGAQPQAAFSVNHQPDRGADGKASPPHLGTMDKHPRRCLEGIGDRSLAVSPFDDARITDLAA